MSMHSVAYLKLVGEILDELPPEPAAGAPRLSDERLREVVQGGRPLTVPEQRAVLRSAETRERLSFFAEVEQAMAYLRWREAGVEPKPVRLKAAAGGAKPLSLDKGEYRLLLMPIDREGREWRLEMKVNKELCRLTPGGFRLVDEEGLEWLSGRPDAEGRIAAYWAHPEPLWDRVHRVKAHLEPR